MKRFLLGAGWFAILWIGFMFLGGMVVGAMASTGTTDPAQAARLGSEAGAAFSAQYGGVVFLSALLIAAAGTLAGWLPGTAAEEG